MIIWSVHGNVRASAMRLFSRQRMYVFTYLLTPWSRVLLEKLTGFAASQEIPHILWNPKVHYLIHKCPPPDVRLYSRLYVSRTLVIVQNKKGEDWTAVGGNLLWNCNNIFSRADTDYSVICRTWIVGSKQFRVTWCRETFSTSVTILCFIPVRQWLVTSKK